MLNPKINTKICQICQKPAENKHFYKEHKIKMADYYEQYFPKKDLLTGEIIKFENLHNYESADFLTKENLKTWLSKSNTEEIKSYLQNILITRKEQKNLIYAPTQVELRSLFNFPSIITYNKFFGNYYRFCESLGFKSRGFRNVLIGNKIKIDNRFNSPFDDFSIFCDTREQKVLNIDYPIEIQTLPYGDYCFCKPKLSEFIYIERKSLTDLISSFTSQISRLRNELIRVKENNAYLFILVEASLSKCLSFNELSEINRKIRVTPEFLFHNIRNIIQEFPCCQFGFVQDRSEAAKFVKLILLSGGLFKNIDFQLFYDKKMF